MLSVVTAVHNSLAINRLYWEALRKNTVTPFELIIVDNHSTDGSQRFFAELAAQGRVVHVRNEFNQSYPASQIQGMRYARHEFLAFLNNDIWMPKGWELPLIEAMRRNPLQVVSPSGQEAQPTQSHSDYLKRKWRWVTQASRAWAKLSLADEETRLWKSLHWMYGPLDKFRSPTLPSKERSMPGLKGDAVLLHRALLEKVPRIWHERIEAADWHLYLTIARLNEQDPTVPLPQILFDSYVHHFGRYSARQSYEPMRLQAPFISIDEFWGADTVKRLWWGNRLPV